MRSQFFQIYNKQKYGLNIPIDSFPLSHTNFRPWSSTYI